MSSMSSARHDYFILHSADQIVSTRSCHQHLSPLLMDERNERRKDEPIFKNSFQPLNKLPQPPSIPQTNLPHPSCISSDPVLPRSSKCGEN